MKNKGFTLAEVLITLAIIGVVAAMTIPTLMTSTRGKEFEVAGNKALSTLANSMSMRYAMNGVTFADYYPTVSTEDSFLSYLVDPPGNRAGEQAALPTTQCKMGSWGRICKFKDGMEVLRAWVAAECNGVAYVVIDTNGEKGPSRFHTDTKQNPTSGRPGCDLNNPNFAYDFQNPNISIRENSDAPSDNNNPDVVVFVVDPHTGGVKPAGQRTRNILATGNAMISQ